VKGSHVVREADDIAMATFAAISQALTPPARPVYLGVPTDLLSAEAGGLPPAMRRGATPRRPTAVPST
jgi:thiamine pyrophosphate-dependent acetolactate synthase large subunit-like protein